MPKVACTSLKTAICLINHPDLSQQLAEKPGIIHRQLELSDIVGVDFPELSSFFRFTFVRDPYARFLSFYFSKIVGKNNQGPVPRFQALGYTEGMTIDQVLDRVEGTSPSELDPHVIPQSAFLMRNNRLQVDFIGHQERIAQDIAVVEAWAGIKLNIGQLNVTKKVEAKTARDTLTSSQRRRVSRLYAKDFELLGYEA